MLIYGDKYMDIEIPNENFGTEYEYPDNNSGFDKNTEKMKQYNTIDLSFLRDCEYKMIYVICFRNTYMVLLCGLKL